MACAPRRNESARQRLLHLATTSTTSRDINDSSEVSGVQGSNPRALHHLTVSTTCGNHMPHMPDRSSSCFTRALTVSATSSSCSADFCNAACCASLGRLQASRLTSLSELWLKNTVVLPNHCKHHSGACRHRPHTVCSYEEFEKVVVVYSFTRKWTPFGESARSFAATFAGRYTCHAL